MDPIQPPEPAGLSIPPPPPPGPPPVGFPGWGAAPGQGGPPFGAVPPPMPSAHGLSTAALICGLAGLVTFWIFGIVPVLAVIFGLVSAHTIKASNGTLRGLGNARAGWILGLVGCAAGAVFLWAGVTGRLDTESDDAAVTTTTVVGAPEVGECVGSLPPGDVVLALDYVSCAVAHEAEVYQVGKLNATGERKYPGEATVLEEVEQGCFDAFEPYVGRSYEESVYGVYYLYPRALGWKPDQGTYVCLLVTPGSNETGSGYQSGR